MGKRKEKITLKAHSEHFKIETKHNQKKEPCCKILTLFYFKVSPSCIIEFMAEYEKLLARSKAGIAPFGKAMGKSQSLHHFIRHSGLFFWNLFLWCILYHRRALYHLPANSPRERETCTGSVRSSWLPDGERVAFPVRESLNPTETQPLLWGEKGQALITRKAKKYIEKYIEKYIGREGI